MPIANLKISVGLVDEQRKGEPISLIADVLVEFFGKPSRATTAGTTAQGRSLLPISFGLEATPNPPAMKRGPPPPPAGLSLARPPIPSRLSPRRERRRDPQIHIVPRGKAYLGKSMV
jgi:hypothetical protein